MKTTKFLALLLLTSFLMSNCSQKQSFKVYDLRCENLINPLAIDNIAPHFSWKIGSTERKEQYSYRIIVSSDSVALAKDEGDLWDSGLTESRSSVMIAYKGNKLKSASLAYWKVKIWDKLGNESAWSPIERFGVGILEGENWGADYIGLNTDKGTAFSPQLRKAFDVEKKTGKYLLHVNSLGYHEVYLNGKKVSHDVLSPAVSQLDERSLSVTYDVTAHIKKGTNDMVLWLGQGWYNKSFFFNNIENGPFVKARLDVVANNKNNTILATDNTWKGSESEYLQSTFFRGEKVDARKTLASMSSKELDKKDWAAVTKVDINVKVSPQMCEPNRIQETIKPASLKKLSDSIWFVDMGKTINGWMELKLPAVESGQEINLQYCDYLNDRGDLANRNQQDIYIAAGTTGEVFRNKFNYNSFRYVKINNLPQEIKMEDLTGYLIYPDFQKTSSFECSDPDLNAIHDMIQYTFQCLTLGGYLVDCPHIERLGYGGDGNASTQTIQTMFGVSPMYYNWMQAWEDCLMPDGGLPHTAPNPVSSGGGPYWCAFVISGSWRTYVNYNDSRLLEKYYPMFQQWLKYVEAYSVDGLLKQWESTTYRNWYLGDWATPSGIDQSHPNSVDLVNNCCVSTSYDQMAKIAELLGKADDKAKYLNKRNELNELIHKTFFDASTNTYGTGTQIDLAYPMLAGVVPDTLIDAVKKQMEIETANRKGHLSTGLVGVPIVTEWAVKNQAVDLMYSMLKKREYPGYLYMIDNGATTTWEHWDGRRSRVHNCFNGIGSWFYEALGGIFPDENAPGYSHVYIQPQMPKGLSWANTSHETPLGTITVNWKKEDTTNIEISIPTGCVGTVIIPDNIKKYTLNGAKMSGNSVNVEAGSHTISY